MLSGRYRCEMLRRHWSQNRDGYCELQPCFSLRLPGSLEHELLECQGLADCRRGIFKLWETKICKSPQLLNIYTRYTSDHVQLSSVMQLLLDPSVLPEVIQLVQSKDFDTFNQLFYLTRTFCASLHKAKMKILGVI